MSAHEYHVYQLQKKYCFAREQGVQSFLDLRFQFSSFKIIREELSENLAPYSDDEDDLEDS